mgnify:CR=1 FL=1
MSNLLSLRFQSVILEAISVIILVGCVGITPVFRYSLNSAILLFSSLISILDFNCSFLDESSLLLLENPELNVMTATDDIDLPSLGEKKKAVFLIVSDTDRSMDILANLFFTQAMNQLCNYADKQCDGRLAIPVRFILDDFGTNLKIVEFPRFISSIRSRGISIMLVLQSESQLREEYKKNADTILAGCDTIVYMGGNDLETAKMIAERINESVQNILWQEIGTIIIIQRGKKPIVTKAFDIWKYK